MRLLEFPLVPAVLGLVLGPLAELQFRRAVAISEGDLAVFVTRPIAAALLTIAALALLTPWIMRVARARPGARDAA
jgi:putative tricarboxylic transport membrane protein